MRRHARSTATHSAENERLVAASRTLNAQLRAALETIDDMQDAEDAPPAAKDDGQNTWPGAREAGIARHTLGA